MFFRRAAVGLLSSCCRTFVELQSECSFVELLPECSFVELKGCSSAELLEVFIREAAGVFIYAELLTVVPGLIGFCTASEVNRFDEATFVT